MAFTFPSTPPQFQTTPQPSPFQPHGFQQSSPFLSQPQPSQQQQQQLQQLQTTPQFQPQQFQQQQQHPQMFLFTNDKAPASYGTKWVDLHPDSQKILLQIEERVLEYRDESQRLDQCSRLYDSSVSNYGFEQDASHIVQELGGISTSMDRQKALLHELMAIVKNMLRNTEVAIRSFMMLRPRFVHPTTGSGSIVNASSQSTRATVPPGSSSQPAATSVVPVFDFYSGLPKKPSPFLQETVARFEKYINQCRQWIEELEQLFLLDSEKNSCNTASLLQSLPKVMLNVHDFFVHVAAKVESIHQYIESMRAAYLADQRRRGDGNDPFLEADRRETARREAAAKRAHPTSHLPLNPQPQTQVAGLLTSSASQGSSMAPQTSAVPATASSGSGFSLFNTPSAPSASMSPSLFTTPSASAPTSSLFGPSSATPQTPLFGSSLSLFASSTPSLLGGTTIPAFGSSTPAGGALFSTPFAAGPSIGSGASFGATSKSSKPKSRTSRR